MELTGKAEELFENWVDENICDDNLIKRPYELYDLPKSMQWGVYQDWADSLGYYMEIQSHRYDDELRFDADVFDGEYVQSSTHKSREQARDAAVDKLNELINGE
jgi:hypothetical protein